ncbi:MAG: transcription antitermination factor NusB [Rhizobiales bacterium 65-9]|nr:transcription antitermination factor NusB [Hyphomicrobiales bacterium]OJY36780.1 MAG: transcription antitermination factor NusB [Rhizobiales bacterium 65-9]
MSRAEKRAAARLGAVQALYELEASEKGVNEALAEFETHWLNREVDEVPARAADDAFFRDLVSGFVREQAMLDQRIDAALQKGWPLRRIEMVLRAILRAASYELYFRPDVPARAVISEYVDVAHAFHERDEAGLINAVLDALARDARPDELARRAN